MAVIFETMCTSIYYSICNYGTQHYICTTFFVKKLQLFLNNDYVLLLFFGSPHSSAEIKNSASVCFNRVIDVQTHDLYIKLARCDLQNAHVDQMRSHPELSLDFIFV